MEEYKEEDEVLEDAKEATAEEGNANLKGDATKSASGKRMKRNTSGRQKGAKKWTKEEVTILLDQVEEDLPAGKDQWEHVAVGCIMTSKSWIRAGDSCKNKFEKLAFQKKPTGTAEIPLHVHRAKKIKELISEKEVIGHIGGNDSDSVRNSDEGTPSSLSLRSAKLSDEDGEVKRPPTKKNKTGQVADAIRDLGQNQVEAAERLENAINGMTEALSAQLGQSAIPNPEETRLAKVEKDITKMQMSLDSILDIVSQFDPTSVTL
jgi:hypothetical protein